MIRTLLIHNPTAGDAEHGKKWLIDVLEKRGCEVHYASTKKSWKHIPPGTELIVIAGGDGTVQKVNRFVVDQPAFPHIPMVAFPLGTANNICRTLGYPKKVDKIADKLGNYQTVHLNFIHCWTHGKPLRAFEAIGCGLFPYHMSSMELADIGTDDPNENMRQDLKHLLDSIRDYPLIEAKVFHDNGEMDGKFLMIEAMNIKSIGTGLRLAPDADPADGLMDLLLLREEDRATLLRYVDDKLDDKDPDLEFPIIRTKQALIRADSRVFHRDDAVEHGGRKLELELCIGMATLPYLVPSPKDKTNEKEYEAA